MREIKFRCWDKENKEMLEVQELDYADSYDGQPMVRTTMCNDYFDIEDMILMQYTGLHDKKGVEIYESDTLEDGDMKWIVKWNFHRMGFSLYPIEENGAFDEMPVNVENKIPFEVIGNIYENPELLEDK